MRRRRGGRRRWGVGIGGRSLGEGCWGNGLLPEEDGELVLIGLPCRRGAGNAAGVSVPGDVDVRSFVGGKWSSGRLSAVMCLFSVSVYCLSA